MKPPEGRPYPVYVRRIPRTWWARTGPYRRFAARELTAVFAAAFSVILLLLLRALSRGRGDYEGFLRWLRLPGIVALSSAILAAVLYHTATWFRLTARILVVRFGRRVVPPAAVTGTLFALWVAVSAVVGYFHLWF